MALNRPSPTPWSAVGRAAALGAEALLLVSALTVAVLATILLTLLGSAAALDLTVVPLTAVAAVATGTWALTAGLLVVLHRATRRYAA